ncbi:serine/threonine-protein kinase 11-interacting protein-like isoform X2 [Palaemon carinicauda]|uniref:serine/threonine-protein kinase 11-interacting protein-like isoform X2 n=1 Tax=Palaemon carinicauda TaxID=392227 RepID=UPI0035B58F05
MDDATLQRVCGLAAAFRQSAHLLLDHQHKLSLDTWTLCEIQEAFSLILEIEQHTNFHVLPPNHRQHPSIPQLQFIYDLLQKVTGLRLWARQGHSLPANETTSLRCFRSLQALELDHVPVTTLKALQSLRPTLKSISSVKGLSRLSDLFIRCGADKAGEFLWEQLQEAVLAHNSLGVLDHSLSLLPRLKILDLSHCELEDASALECLPSVTHIDISHNLLRLIPKFSSTAQYTLVVLIASNNLFSHIDGLQNTNNLEELDLRENVLSLQGVLSPLGALPHLRVLRLHGNPVTYNQNYRMHLIKQLNPATSNHKICVDGIPITAQEEAMVGLMSTSGSSSYSPELLSSLTSFSPFCSPVNFPTVPDIPSQPLFEPNREEESLQEFNIPSQPSSLTQEPLASSVKSTGPGSSFACDQAALMKVWTNGQQRRKLRKKRTRQIAIAEPDKDFNDDEPVPDPNIGNALSHSLSLLDGVPNPPPPSLAADSLFLPLDTNTVAQAITTLTCQDEISNVVPEQSDRLLERILQETTEPPGTCTEILVTSKPDEIAVSGTPTETEKDGATEDSVQSISEEVDKSLEESRDSSIFDDNSKGYSGHTSDCTPSESESEDEKEDVQLFLVKKETVKTVRHASVLEDEVLNIEESIVEQDIILAITSLFFKEKNSLTARTIYKWDLCSIESMELLSVSPHKVLITFDTIKSTYKKRTYIFESSDYQDFSSVLSPILEKNTLEKVLDSAMTCLKCNTQFSRELARQSDGSNLLKCPNCGGGVVVRVDRVDHPSVSVAGFDEHVPRSSTPLSQALTQASCLPSSDIPTCPGESSESVSVCSEASSCVRRESDVEVISNPSISSIEILNDQQLIHDVIPEEDIEEQKPPPPAAVNSDARTPANSPSTFHKPESSTGMQESSSSGSMTGSVCTTYEKSGSLPTSPLKNPIHHHSQTDLMDSKNLTLDSHNETSGLLFKTAESSMLSTTVYGTPPHSTGSSPRHFSSSSTSIDTIKNDCMIPSLHHKAVMTSLVVEKESEAVTQRSLTSWVQSLLHTLTGYGWLWWEEVEDVEGSIPRIANPVRYSYEDFSDIDHRLKLHCEVLLFHEPEEFILGLVKAVLLVKGGLREYQGIVVLSSKKIYILEIVGPEDDSPQTWLEERSSYNLSEVHVIHSLYQRQGVGLTLGDSVLLISLADSHRANCFFNFFLESLEEYGVSPSIEECSPAQEESLTEIIKETQISPVDETGLSMFAIVSLLLDGGCSESQFLTMTSTDLFLFHANLEWYMPPSPDSKLKLNITQKIANIISIEVHSDRHLALQFLDEASGAESSWELHVTTPVAACHIIQGIRTPWTHLFSVDLEDFIGVYRTSEGDVLSMTRTSLDEGTRQEKEENQSWCQVSAVYGKLKYDPKYPILGYSDDSVATTPKIGSQEELACEDRSNDSESKTLIMNDGNVDNSVTSEDHNAASGCKTLEKNEDNSSNNMVESTPSGNHSQKPPVFQDDEGKTSVTFGHD